MEKKLVLITLAVFAFAFGTVLCSNAGTETVEPYRAPARGYNYGPPPPRPVFYPPPPPIGFGVFVGPRFGFFHGHGFHGRRVFFHGHHHHHGH